jgi:hypothetical protein
MLHQFRLERKHHQGKGKGKGKENNSSDLIEKTVCFPEVSLYESNVRRNAI